MKKIFLLLFFILFVNSIQAQKFDFPDVHNTVSSVETAFLALLHNMAYLSEKSTMVDHIKYEDTDKRYIEYIDFVLNNMIFENVKSYFLRISENVERINRHSLSKKQQEDFEYFLQTAIVDSWTFGTGRIDTVNLPHVENRDINLDVFNNQIIQEQNNITAYEGEINALLNLADIQKTIDDAVKEYRGLQNSTPKTARAVQDREKRLSELKDIEMAARRQYRDVSAQRSSLSSRISSTRTKILNIELQRESAIKSSHEETLQNFINNLHDNINNFYQWKDFFDNKNTIVTEFLIVIDIRGHLMKIIDEYIPQRQVPTYQQQAIQFFSGWGMNS